MLRIEDYYTDAPSAGIITMLEKPEIVNRLMNMLMINFKGFDYMKLMVDVGPVREELEEYKNMNRDFLDQIHRLRAFYDGNQLALKRILRDINHDTHMNSRVYSPVVGCPIGCSYCFTKRVVDHFCITENFRKPVFRGFYKIYKDDEGNDIPELFNIDNEEPIDWFLTYMSDFGCWRPEWQENVLQQVVAANGVKDRSGKARDTFQLVTKRPKGIRLDSFPEDLDMRNVIISCTVDRNDCTDRITELIERAGRHKVTGCIVYQPVLEYIEPVHLEELVNTFGKDNSWVIVGGEIGENAKPFKFEWIKDIVDKCLELGIPLKMEHYIVDEVKASGYEFVEQAPKSVRDSNEVRRRNIEMRNQNAAAHYNEKVAEFNKKIMHYDCSNRSDIAALTLLGDVDVTVESAKRLLSHAPEFDIILTAETKGIPVAYEMARQSGKNYIIARKNRSISASAAEKERKFFVDEDDVRAMKGKRVLIVDDIISTGESLKALEALVEESEGISSAKAAVLAEGTAVTRNDIIFLEALPAFAREKQ